MRRRTIWRTRRCALLRLEWLLRKRRAASLRALRVVRNVFGAVEVTALAAARCGPMRTARRPYPRTDQFVRLLGSGTVTAGQGGLHTVVHDLALAESPGELPAAHVAAPGPLGAQRAEVQPSRARTPQESAAGWHCGGCGRALASGRPDRQRCPVPLVRLYAVRNPAAGHAFGAVLARLLHY